MKFLKLAMMFLAITAMTVSFAFADGDAEKGKALFNDPRLAEGTSGKSCNSCHPDGKGLLNAPGKKRFKIMGKKIKSLEDAVNFWIKKGLRGKEMDLKSEEMSNLIAYIKSLKSDIHKEKQ